MQFDMERQGENLYNDFSRSKSLSMNSSNTPRSWSPIPTNNASDERVDFIGDASTFLRTLLLTSPGVLSSIPSKDQNVSYMSSDISTFSSPSANAAHPKTTRLRTRSRVGSGMNAKKKMVVYYVFELSCDSEGFANHGYERPEGWCIFRRYSDFTNFVKSLDKLCTAYVPILPEKSAWSLRGSTSSSPEKISKRQRGLLSWLRDAIVMQQSDTSGRTAIALSNFLLHNKNCIPNNVVEAEAKNLLPKHKVFHWTGPKPKEAWNSVMPPETSASSVDTESQDLHRRAITADSTLGKYRNSRITTAARTRDVVLNIKARLHNYLIEMARWHEQRPRFIVSDGLYSGDNLSRLREASEQFGLKANSLWGVDPHAASCRYDTIIEALNRTSQLPSLIESLNNVIEAAITTEERDSMGDGLEELLALRSEDLESSLIAQIEHVSVGEAVAHGEIVGSSLSSQPNRQDQFESHAEDDIVDDHELKIDKIVDCPTGPNGPDFLKRRDSIDRNITVFQAARRSAARRMSRYEEPRKNTVDSNIPSGDTLTVAEAIFDNNVIESREPISPVTGLENSHASHLRQATIINDHDLAAMAKTVASGLKENSHNKPDVSVVEAFDFQASKSSQVGEDIFANVSSHFDRTKNKNSISAKFSQEIPTEIQPDPAHFMRKPDSKGQNVQRANVFDLFSMAEPQPVHVQDTIDVSQKYDGGIGADLQCPPSQENVRSLKIRFAEYHEKGKRPTMEDESVMIGCVGEDVWPMSSGRTDIAYFGIYDGHGGKECANTLSKTLHRYIFASDHFPSDIEAAIIDGCDRCDKFACDMSSGSTAVFCIMIGETIWFANVGDSEAVVSIAGQAQCMSLAHRPSLSAEKNRIAAAGGFVKSGRVMGMLAVSRAFGDIDSKPTRSAEYARFYKGDFVIAEPYVQSLNRFEGDLIEFIILACDGLFDRVTKQDSVDLVRESLRTHGSIQKAAEDLVERALLMHSTDNVSVMIICLGQE